MKNLIKLYIEKQNLIKSVGSQYRYELESILDHNLRCGTIYLASLVNPNEIGKFDDCVKVVLECIDQLRSDQSNLTLCDTVSKMDFDAPEMKTICYFLATQYVNLWIYTNEIEQLDAKRAFVYFVAELRSTFKNEINEVNFETTSIQDIVTEFMDIFRNDNNS